MNEEELIPYKKLYSEVIKLAITDIRKYLRRTKYRGDELPDPYFINNSNVREAIQFLDKENTHYKWMCDILDIRYEQPIEAALNWRKPNGN